ncbi:hypothetical protein GCM10022236_07700 [Microlunatus ginsengisoli]|uniref:Uncharacterized protein n=1 Tax=Microlunatus ginsengisoli TaxID=363863 RepID=A0ABP6ZH06_9ACTN
MPDRDLQRTGRDQSRLHLVGVDRQSGEFQLDGFHLGGFPLDGRRLRRVGHSDVRVPKTQQRRTGPSGRRDPADPPGGIDADQSAGRLERTLNHVVRSPVQH